MRVKDVQLAQLKGKTASASPPLDGVLQARLVLDGTGDSGHRVLASSSGSVTAVVPRGDVRAAFAELTGIDVAEGRGLLLKKPDARDSIRCGRGRSKCSSLLSGRRERAQALYEHPSAPPL
jgi:hypothetical protein